MELPIELEDKEKCCLFEFTCRRLNLSNNTECGKTPVVDTYHKVCQQHSDERKKYHTEYHLWEKAKFAFLSRKINRAELKAEYKKELELRRIYEHRYQLDEEYCHEIYKQNMEKELAYLVSLKVALHEDTLKDIMANKNLSAFNLEMDTCIEEVVQPLLADVIARVVEHRNRINYENRVVCDDWEEDITDEQRQEEERKCLFSQLVYQLEEAKFNIAPSLDVVGKKYTEHLKKMNLARKVLQYEMELMEQMKYYEESNGQMEIDDDQCEGADDSDSGYDTIDVECYYSYDTNSAYDTVDVK